MNLKPKKSRKKSKYVFQTRTDDQARSILGFLFSNYGHEFLTNYLYQWQLAIAPHPEADAFIEKLDVILQEYSTHQLMDPDCDIEGMGKNPYARFTGLFIFLLSLVEYNGKVYGRKIEKQDQTAWSFKTTSKNYLFLLELMEEADIGLVQQVLTEALVQLTGKKFYRRFVSKMIVDGALGSEAIESIETDPEFSVYKQQVILFLAFRSFVDASFFLFGRQK